MQISTMKRLLAGNIKKDLASVVRNLHVMALEKGEHSIQEGNNLNFNITLRCKGHLLNIRRLLNLRDLALGKHHLLLPFSIPRRMLDILLMNISSNSSSR